MRDAVTVSLIQFQGWADDQNPGISINKVGSRSRNPTTISRRMNFHIFPAHWPYGIFATDSTAISTPEQGVIIFVNPSPNWKAITVACRETPIISENGAMIGMVTAALAEAEGMKRFMNV